ncbi:hypothetical protein LCGC14_1221720 [marine sediment metagenome]|uniref:Uncharacterized protein n=1 Tax=marine sediment metagenome TaxID=412755 RepID=A0A0F9LF14_9ZZZZ
MIREELETRLGEWRNTHFETVGGDCYCHKPYIDCLAEEIERLLADERNPMECGHPKSCLVEREVTNIEKNEGPLNDTEYCCVLVL